MANLDLNTTTIAVFTRHNDDCSKRKDPTWRRCKCRKSIYIYENGSKSYISAKTRSWEQAERVAQEMRDQRDPIKRAEAKLKARESLLADALDQWINGLKPKGATLSSYQTVKKQIMTWADSKGILNINDVTPDALDAWKASWDEKDNTQGFRLSRVKAFFRWAFAIGKIDRDPAAVLRSIKREDAEETQPLTPAQFEELLAATYKY
ncbi:MAG: hypothetical protein WCC26_15075, partial [Terracidiphilus sp.]